MAQMRKNVCSTKLKPFEESGAVRLIKKKKRDVYIKVYNLEKLGETIYSDQTDQFHTQLLYRNRYIMIMVEINSNNIVVEPTRSS